MCPACNGSGVLTDNPSVLRCERCGGIYSQRNEPITLEEVRKYVNYTQMRPEPLKDQFYFDFYIVFPSGEIDRMHGWACSETKQVVQWG